MTAATGGPVRAGRALGLVLCLSLACSKAPTQARSLDASVVVNAPSAETKAPSNATKKSKPPTKAATAPANAPAPQETQAVQPIGKAAEDDLKTEEPEANPYSETVTLRIAVTPQVKALVMWGGKQVAKLAPGSMDAEIVRPRGSGPVDLEVKADGYMPYHTRLYSDRDDKVGVRLYRPEEAPGLFGYKRPPSTK